MTASTTKKKSRSSTPKRQSVSDVQSGETIIEWGLYRRNGNNGFVDQAGHGCLLSGREFKASNSTKALESAFSSIAQVINELNLDRSTEVRVSIRKRD